tara:strand:- start:2906 stop:3199 length:294 start_codon:yes stop_codon:yes gene_type:complete
MGTLDILLKLFPNMKKDDTHSKEAKSLYKLWCNSSCQISDRSFTRPLNISLESVIDMQKKGFIDYDGDKIIITDNGSELLNKMILDDDDFSIIYKKS